MYITLYKTRLFFLLLMLGMLSQCTTALQPPQTILQVREKPKSPYNLPAASYLAMAKQGDPQKQNSFLLAAATQLLLEGQWRPAYAILAQTQGLTPSQDYEKNLLLAKGELMRNRPKQALAKLATVHEAKDLPLYQQIQFHELLALSHKAMDNKTESIAERMQLEALLVDEESLNSNRRLLWFTLIHLPQEELSTMALEANLSPEWQGWLQLALISQRDKTQSPSVLAALQQWQSQFPHHPAQQFLSSFLGDLGKTILTQPKQIALLLPLSGPLSAPGNALREGFMAAYQAHGATKTTGVKIYDTEKQDIVKLYQQALTEGADYVVGPLTKGQTALLAGIPHPVPTLLLNEAKLDKAQENSYWFALSPRNEAVQVAIKAKTQGYNKALIIAPVGDWGKEITEAFGQQWKKEGGQIAATFFYDAKEDLNQKMRDFLQVTDSQTREKQLKQLLGQPLQASTSRRQDFDMIFLLAYPSKARQIMPLLKYYYAGDVPVYSTSSAYSGNADPLKDKDLDGLMFCDLPWVFAHQVGTRNWPESWNSYNRLYALGMDSYALVMRLTPLKIFPAQYSKETSTTLYLKPSQQITHLLEWGQFKQGLAHSLGEAA